MCIGLGEPNTKATETGVMVLNEFLFNDVFYE